MSEPSPTILCVDDDPEILEVLREYLTRQGFHVVFANELLTPAPSLWSGAVVHSLQEVDMFARLAQVLHR